MSEAAQALLKTWRRHGHGVGFAVGISQGYATLDQIGFAERMDTPRSAPSPILLRGSVARPKTDRYKVPERVWFRTTLPKNVGGKLERGLLREQLISQRSLEL